MRTLKTLTFWLLLLLAHGCTLSSDLEMEEQLHAHAEEIRCYQAYSAGVKGEGC